MKRICAILIALTTVFTLNAQQKIYTVIYNQSPERGNFPVMIGGVNVAQGNNRGLQIGFANLTNGWQNGMQMGLFNATGRDVTGTQMGLINAFAGKQHGLMMGLVNIVGKNVDGAQFGLFNLFGGNARGAQFGVINAFAGSADGAQFGIFNAIAGNTRGVQFGVVNLTNRVEGVQFGVVNMVNHYDRGVPVGLLSIVRHGGFQAVEVSTSSLFPVNVAFKSGLDKLYTSIICAYNPDFHTQMAFGAGFGSVVGMSKRFFFNPELNYISTFGKESASFIELYPNVGYRFGAHFSVLAAPTLSMQHISNSSRFNSPLYSLYSNRIDSRNELYIGLRFALRYNFEW